MPRDKYRPVELTEALRPVAAPVDTFVQAQVPSRDTSLQDLARSLSNLGGSLSGLVGQRDREAEEADRIRGEADFHTNNQQGFAEAVASGAIPAQASTAYVQAWKKAQGEVAGGVLEQKFAVAYEGFAGKTSADPKVYDAFVRDFLRENISTQDPDILRGLLPKIRQVTSNYLQRHIGDVSKATQQGALETAAAKDSQAIAAANSAGLASRKGTDYEAVFREIETNREANLKVGQNREKYDQQVVDGITAAAVQHRDPKILDFLDRKVPGQDYTWSNTPYGRDQRQKTIDTLESVGRRSIADDEKRRREEKATAKDDITRRTIQAITSKPTEPIPEDLLAAGEKVDPDFRVNAIRWRDTIGRGANASDPVELLGVTADILNGGGVQRVQRAMRDGVFKNAQDLTRAYKLAEGMTTEGPKLDAMLKGGASKTILDTIRKQTASDKDASKYFDDGSVSPEGLQAQTDFRLQVLAWRQANPEAGPIEQEKALAEIGASMLKRIQQPEERGPVGYDRAGLGTPNAYGAKPPAAGADASGGPTVTKVPNPMQPAPVPLPNALPETDALGNPIGGASVSPGVAPAPPQPAPAPQPVAPPTAPPAGQPKVLPQPPPAESQQPRQAPPADAGAWFNSLPAATRSLLETKAANEKKPLSLKVQELYERGVAVGSIPKPAPAPGKQSMMRAPDGTPIEAASAEAPEQQDTPPAPDTVRLIGEAFERALAGSAKPQGNYTLAVIKDNPKAARILDFVAGPESNGNYNAYFSNAGSKRDLSAMTLDEVMAWSGNRGTKSSATGRYQFMKATLKDLKGQMGLSGSEKFTPELQDRMAMQLLERRGFSKWAAGKMSDTQFGNNLALEWASLPNLAPQNGRPAGVSAYAGDGLNKSHVSPAQVMAALTGSAALPGAALQQVAQAEIRKPSFVQRIIGMFARKPTTRV